MNKQSNVYTIIYIIVLVVVVGAGLALTSMALKPKQKANADADKMRQILMAAHLTPADGESVIDLFNQRITEQYIVNAAGEKIEGDAFDVNVKAQTKLPDAERKLPVYVCTLTDGVVKYILPVYGVGLWGPIWGYVAVDADGSEIYGAYFSHESETPGLGAKIADPDFYEQFNPAAPGSKPLNLFKDGEYMGVDVVKKGMKPLTDCDYVDGISGGTITSKGVGAMLNDCLKPYEAFLKTLSNNK